ncbi:pectin lyase fold/virulence factor [Mycena olivaceomarginata]|nr:pectin lyase fold/virulence factor [Mycena olivaceomarginata]
MDYHAVGDGIADDTDAINNAIADGGRCGQGCFLLLCALMIILPDESNRIRQITAAIVFFPPGKYCVTKPIIPFCYTSLVGDYKSKPTLVADANFQAIAVIDADPYIPGEVARTFTIRNVKITNAVSAIHQQWNWGFTWENIQISNCQVGFDLNTGGLTQPTQMSSSQPSSLAGSVILDNVKFTGISTANIQDSAGTVVATNAANVPQWFQGNVYLGSPKPARSSPDPGHSKEIDKDIQFFSIMAIELGAKGDGVSDDSVAINTFLSKVSVPSEGRTLERFLALSAVCGSLSKPYQPHPTSTVAIGAANERHRPGEAVINEGDAH